MIVGANFMAPKTKGGKPPFGKTAQSGQQMITAVPVTNRSVKHPGSKNTKQGGQGSVPTSPVQVCTLFDLYGD